MVWIININHSHSHEPWSWTTVVKSSREWWLLNDGPEYCTAKVVEFKYYYNKWQILHLIINIIVFNIRKKHNGDNSSKTALCHHTFQYGDCHYVSSHQRNIMVCRRYENVVGEGVQVLCEGPRGKFSKLGATSGPCTRSAHLIPSWSDVLKFDDFGFKSNIVLIV